MSGTGTTKDENYPHPSLPHRGGGIQGGGLTYKSLANSADMLNMISGSSTSLNPAASAFYSLFRAIRMPRKLLYIK